MAANHLKLTEASKLNVSGGMNGGAGGRIFLSGYQTLDNEGDNNLISDAGEGAVSGSGGTIRFDRMLKQATLVHFNGTLTIDTNLGIIEHSDGTRHYGLIEDRS